MRVRRSVVLPWTMALFAGACSLIHDGDDHLISIGVTDASNPIDANFVDSSPSDGPLPQGDAAQADAPHADAAIVHPANAIEWKASNGGSGHFYLWVMEKSNVQWSAASFSAQSMGGHLITIANLAELQFASSLAIGKGAGQHLGYVGAYLPAAYPLGDTTHWLWVVPAEKQPVLWGTGEPSDGRTTGIYCTDSPPTLASCAVADYPDGFGLTSYIVEFE